MMIGAHVCPCKHNQTQPHVCVFPDCWHTFAPVVMQVNGSAPSFRAIILFHRDRRHIPAPRAVPTPLPPRVSEQRWANRTPSRKEKNPSTFVRAKKVTLVPRLPFVEASSLASVAVVGDQRKSSVWPQEALLSSLATTFLSCRWWTSRSWWRAEHDGYHDKDGNAGTRVLTCTDKLLFENFILFLIATLRRNDWRVADPDSCSLSAGWSTVNHRHN